MRYVDSLIVVVTALKNFLKSKNGTFENPNNEKGVCGIGKAEPWKFGEEFFGYIMKVMNYNQSYK